MRQSSAAPSHGGVVMILEEPAGLTQKMWRSDYGAQNFFLGACNCQKLHRGSKTLCWLFLTLSLHLLHLVVPGPPCAHLGLHMGGVERGDAGSVTLMD